MTLELSTPMRVTWEVPSDPELAGAMLDRLEEARALFVDAELSPESAPALAKALDARGLFKPRLTVVGGARALGAFAEGCGGAPKVAAALLFDGETAEEARDLKARFNSLSLGLWSTGEGLAGFGAALEVARGEGLALSLMNPHADAKPLQPGVVERVAKAWEAGGAGVRLTVHDLFLAERLGLDPWKAYKGCAAGVSLAHLTSDGWLTACRTLPILLGDATSETLAEIWRGPARRELRMRIGKPARECAGCARLSCCLGGCPGLADPPGTRDRSCPGPERE